MKTKVTRCWWMALFCLGNSLLTGVADEPARDKGAPIIFSDSSAPTARLMSSNLNELRKPQAPLRHFESDLNRPLDLFRFDGRNNVIAPHRPVTPPRPVERKSTKQQLNEAVEDAYLMQGLGGAKNLRDDELFGLDDKDADPYKPAPRRTLERYYDRLDQARAAVTNQPSEAALSFRDEPALEQSASGRKLGSRQLNESPAPVDAPRGPNAYLPAIRSSAEGISARRLGENSSFNNGVQSSWGDTFSRPPSRLSEREARMENFKRLLEGPRSLAIPSRANPNPAYHQSGSYSSGAISSSAPTVSNPGPSSRSPGSGSNLTPAGPQQEFVKSGNLMGDPLKPQGLPELKALPGLQDPQPVISPPLQHAPVPTFKIPRRRI
ncbi:MAG TPA: hypothetical protein PKN95_01365 [Verrucomicrobiota bacterium]|nr:hypothetical protein [Verrucomicrobiota bacterium]HNT13786.1 hypothetical protein [Verrucomicrobiota bacterium]